MKMKLEASWILTHTLSVASSPPPPTPPTRTTSSMPRPDRPIPPQMRGRHQRNASDGNIMDALNAAVAQQNLMKSLGRVDSVPIKSRP